MPVPTIFQLIYCSTAVRLMEPETLRELLAQSRERNSRENITGLLLYYDGEFVQALEGLRENVEQVFASIQRDARHHGIVKICEGWVAQREFADWQMAFHWVTSPSDLPDGFSDFLNSPWSGQEFTSDPQRCQSLLLGFKRRLR